LLVLLVHWTILERGDKPWSIYARYFVVLDPLDIRAPSAPAAPSYAYEIPQTNSRQGSHQKLQGFAEITNIRINTVMLAEDRPVQVTVHIRRVGQNQIHALYLSPSVIIVTFDNPTITEKDDADADAAAWRHIETIKALVRKLPMVDFPSGSEDIFQTAVSPALSRLQVEGFPTSRTRIYLLVVMGWKDANDTAGNVDTCEWLQAMPYVDVGLQSAAWHQCRRAN